MKTMIITREHIYEVVCDGMYTTTEYKGTDLKEALEIFNDFAKYTKTSGYIVDLYQDDELIMEKY